MGGSQGDETTPATAPSASKERRGYDNASLYDLITFGFVSNLIRVANERLVSEDDVSYLIPDSDSAVPLARAFDEEYIRVQAREPQSRLNKTFRVLLNLYWPALVLHSFWTLLEIGFRLTAPVVLRYFLIYLQDYSNGASREEWNGWLLAVALGSCSFGLTMIHHQQFWVGMRMGFTMRQQCIAAVHAKALRLTGPAISAINSGRVVNLVSNDVRRFDDAMPFWVFLWAGPLELGMVFLMIAKVLGVVPALSGVSVTLLLIPIQAALVRPVAGIRKATAACTDERVRLAGEAINGALAMKMLSWEAPIAAALCRIRSEEARHISHMAYIRACNLALQFAVTPLVAFATFSVTRAVKGELDVPNVFYALSLLNLPKLYMIQFFVTGIQNCTELSVSIKRIDAFLSQPEPPAPSLLHATPIDPSQHAISGKHGPMSPTPASAPASASTSASCVARVETAAYPVGYVAMRGEDYNWSQPFGAKLLLQIAALRRESRKGPTPGGRQNAASASDGALSRTATGISAKDQATLSGISFVLQPGELLGVAGEVGSGKSSLLMALLGDLQPTQTPSSSPSYSNGQDAVPSDSYGQLTVITEEGHSGSYGQLTGQKHKGNTVTVTLEAGQGEPSCGAILCGSLAYCSQIPWIVAGTVQDNIVFGSPWDEDRYNKVIASCALVTDIEGLPDGDETELGERGINLSGGQKARLALARACYSQASILLLDDPLSAVDPRVGRTLFDKAIGPDGLMQGSTRILVTHQRQFLPRCDRIMVLRDGRMAALGTWKELSAMELPEIMTGAEGLGAMSVDELADSRQAENGGGTADGPQAASDGAAAAVAAAAVATISDAVAAAADPMGIGAVNSSSAEATASDTPSRKDGSPFNNTPSFAPIPSMKPSQSMSRFALSGSCSFFFEAPRPAAAGAAGSSTFRNLRSMLSMGLGSRSRSFFRSKGSVQNDGVVEDGEVDPLGGGAKKGQLVQLEGMEKGSVSFKVYWQYCQQLGTGVSVVLLVALVGGQAVYLATDWWLSLWARSDAEEQLQMKWIWVYGLLTGLVLTVAFGRSFLFFRFTVLAATRIHDAMARRVLRAPLSFFHTNPAGRILNRFSKDLGMVDDLLPTVMFDFFQTFFLVVSAFVLVSIAVPVILPVFVPLALFFYYLRHRYVNCSREVKRWEAVTRSPVFAFFSATLKGLSTIRAFSAQDRFHDAFLKSLGTTGMWSFSFFATARWIGFRLDVIACVTLNAATLLAMVMRSRVSVALLGLALSYVLQLTGLMQWMVRQSAEVENNMTALERLLDYTRLEQEPPNVGEEGGASPPAGWPASGALCYESVTATYRPGLPPVLVDISFELRGGSSCGVVGRTGSGKSSLMLTLFRLIDLTAGTIRLDGLDISTIGLDALRSQLAIIPQDPVLFSGTLRSNLDPWNLHPDSKLWDVLAMVNLKEAIEAAGGLHHTMQEGGDNLSVGQRQLFCLARALLQNARVLALDEATANVDRATDALIQQALADFAHQDPAAGHVLLVIAHRIDTIMDCDHLLVLNAGRLIESGAPSELVAGPSGLFSSMVQAAKMAGNK